MPPRPAVAFRFTHVLAGSAPAGSQLPPPGVLRKCEDQAIAALAPALAQEEELSAAACGAQGARERAAYSKRRMRYVDYDLELELSGMTEAEVYQAFRMPRDSLTRLLLETKPYLTTENPDKGRNSSGHTLTAAQRMLCGLRLIYGGSAHDIKKAYAPISYSRVYDALWLLCDALHKVFGGKWKFPLPPHPDDETVQGIADRHLAVEALKGLELRHRATSPSQCWLGQVGSIDGCVIPQQNPGRAVPNPKIYKCTRKGCFGILLMGLVDCERRFLWYNMSFAPTTHDSTAFKQTPFGKKLCEWLPPPFFVNGDAAFQPGGDTIMVPGGSDAYNFTQSSQRMPIEMAFGELIGMCGILWQPLRVKFNRRAALISACILLHNMRIDWGLERDYAK